MTQRIITMTITYCPRIYTNDTLIFYSHEIHERHRNCTSRWLVDWRRGGKCCFTTFPVVCRALSSESELSSDMALQMTYRCSRAASRHAFNLFVIIRAYYDLRSWISAAFGIIQASLILLSFARDFVNISGSKKERISWILWVLWEIITNNEKGGADIFCIAFSLFS